MDALKKITRQLKDQDEIAFAYIYGSVARGEEREDSDIDIAAYLTHHPTLEDPLLEFNLALELEKDIKRKVDLRILNIAPVTFIHQVFKHGKLLFSRDENLRIKFESQKMDEYLDFLPLLEEYDKKRLERYGLG
ncbi:MAG: hypothetical protein BME94_08585 [Methanobacteriales archaeon Met13]